MSQATITPTEHKMPTLEEVDAYPVPELLVPRIMKLYDRSQEYAEDIVREAKRMLYLHKLTGKSVSPSVEIDDAWHEMLMFTKFYQQFCNFIGGFVHHCPTPPRDPNAPPRPKAEGPTVYQRTQMLYKERFGEDPNPTYWT